MFEGDPGVTGADNIRPTGFANTSESNEESMAIVKRAFPGGPWDFETRISRLFDEALPDLSPDFVQVSMT